MSKIAVSACLVGLNTKYNGGNNYNQAVVDYLKGKDYIIICPESIYLPNPRLPSEINNGKVINKEGLDVSKQFIDGANLTYKILKEANVNEVILKANSPSCGYKKIYDGNFNGTLIDGNGILVQLLLNDDIKIYTEKDIERMKK